MERKETNVSFFNVLCEHLHDFGVAPLQQTLEFVHEKGGFPWWACIVAGAVGIRTLILPLRVHSLYHQLLLAQSRQDAIAKVITRNHSKLKTDKAKASALQAAFYEAATQRGTHPFKPLLPLSLHMPLLLSIGGALRSMSAFPFLGMSITGGGMVEGWDQGGLFGSNLGVTNLWLSGLVAVSNVMTIEWMFRRGAMSTNTVGTKGFMYYLMHGVNIISSFILSMLPASINFFVFLNNCLAVGEGILVRASWIVNRLKSRIKRINTIYYTK